MHDYDLCVIGGGPAGFAAAMRAWDCGRRVCLVHRGPLGGAGIHNGALSSKTLWELSRDYRAALRRDRGFTATSVDVDFTEVLQVVERAIDEKTQQLAFQLEELARPRPGERRLVDSVSGHGRFVDPHTLVVDGPGTKGARTIDADSFIVATGSRPRELPDVAIDGQRILSSDHLGSLRSFPDSLVILGAGVIGCEFATIFANFGKTKVYLIDRAERILPFEDEDVAQLCSTNLEAKGVTIHHGAKLVDMRVAVDGVRYTIEHPSGQRETIRVDKALVAVGRVPNTEDLGLTRIGVELDARGYIVADDTQTRVPHVYAAGDVTQDVALVSVGEIEGRHAALRSGGAELARLSYDNLATIMFLDPEVAAIGLTEQQAQARRIPYRVAVYDYGLVNRAIAMRATEGFVKLLVSDDHEMRVLGLRALGVHASTTLEAISLIMQHRRCAGELAELLHPHPAVTEGLQDCVRMLLGTSIYKPEVFRRQLRLARVDYDSEGVARLH